MHDAKMSLISMSLEYNALSKMIEISCAQLEHGSTSYVEIPHYTFSSL